jgi:hypothetical protein
VDAAEKTLSEMCSESQIAPIVCGQRDLVRVPRDPQDATRHKLRPPARKRRQSCRVRNAGTGTAQRVDCILRDRMSKGSRTGFETVGNRMLEQPSPHTGRPYARSTINDRVRSVCRFYDWVHRRGWIAELPFQAIDVRILSGRKQSFLAHVDPRPAVTAANVLTISEYEKLPRPLRVDQLKLLFANLAMPYRLMAEWAVATGLRRKELCGLTVAQVPTTSELDAADHPLVGIPLVITKGDRPRTAYPVGPDHVLRASKILAVSSGQRTRTSHRAQRGACCPFEMGQRSEAELSHARASGRCFGTRHPSFDEPLTSWRERRVHHARSIAKGSPPPPAAKNFGVGRSRLRSGARSFVGPVAEKREGQ